MKTSVNPPTAQGVASARWRIAGKVLAAILTLSGLALVAANSLWPGHAWWQVLLSGVGLCVAVVSLIAAYAVIVGRVNRFNLNHGATDAQWMWWGGEPPGLQKARGDASPHADLSGRTPPPSP